MSTHAQPDNQGDEDPLLESDEAETQLGDDAVTPFFGAFPEGNGDEDDDVTPATRSGPPQTELFTFEPDSFYPSEAHVPMDSSAEDETPEHPAHSLLIVEDDAWAARLLLTLLKGASDTPLAFVQARSLQEGLAQLQSHRIQLILTDLGLPDSGVEETVPRLRQAAPQIPVIVLSGYPDEQLRRRTLQAGATSYLIKGEVGNEAIVAEILTRLNNMPPLEDAGE